jgi:ribonuclease P protein component
MALPRFLRFESRGEVKDFLRRGAQLSTPLGRAVCAVPRSRRGRILFVISTRVSKRATVRNRIKRELDGWLTRQARGPLEVDAVIFVNPVALECSARARRALLEQTLTRLRRCVPRR